MATPPVVLVVEDNAELRHVLKEALGCEGYHVLAARDETETLDLLREHQVDLLISDLTDPQRASRALEQVTQEFPDLPVVALSEAAANHPAFFFEAWQGPSGYRALSKPFRLAELLALSREMLG